MKDLKHLAINDGPKRFLRRSNIGEHVEVRNLDMEGVMIDVRIDDIAGEHYLGTVTKIHGQLQGLQVGNEVRFPMDCAVRCYDEKMQPI